jgi:hypothetical protein
MTGLLFVIFKELTEYFPDLYCAEISENAKSVQIVPLAIAPSSPQPFTLLIT